MPAHYDLDDLSLLSPDERAQQILQKLRSEKLYAPTRLYRGLMATPARLAAILARGTDRIGTKNKYALKPDPRIACDEGKAIGDEVERLDRELDNDPNAVWAAPETELGNIISIYATAEADGPKNAQPTVLVYDGKKLAWRGVMEVYDFRKGVKPLDALVAAFTFREF